MVGPDSGYEPGIGCRFRITLLCCGPMFAVDGALPTQYRRPSVSLVLIPAPNIRILPEIEPANGTFSAMSTVHSLRGDECVSMPAALFPLNLTAMVCSLTAK